jgi:hypothetical protein
LSHLLLDLLAFLFLVHEHFAVAEMAAFHAALRLAKQDVQMVARPG